jgi:ABC-type transport system involved in cytochrome c biogenesis ATPase subunit
MPIQYLKMPCASSGKTTLLRILAGQHMVQDGEVLVLGRPAFHDTQLSMEGVLTYLGTEVCKRLYEDHSYRTV